MSSKRNKENSGKTSAEKVNEYRKLIKGAFKLVKGPAQIGTCRKSFVTEGEAAKYLLNRMISLDDKIKNILLDDRAEDIPNDVKFYSIFMKQRPTLRLIESPPQMPEEMISLKDDVETEEQQDDRDTDTSDKVSENPVSSREGSSGRSGGFSEPSTPKKTRLATSATLQMSPVVPNRRKASLVKNKSQPPKCKKSLFRTDTAQPEKKPDPNPPPVRKYSRNAI